MDNAQLTTWLNAAGTGDQKAFRALAEALSQRMFGLAFRLMNNNRSSAEDVVQEVLIKLWTHAPKWQNGGSVSAYASRLVYTTAMDQHRKSKPEDELSAEIPAKNTIQAKVEAEDEHNVLMKGIKQLPDRQREAILLSYFHEHKQKEIAKIMGTTEKAVESLLIRARRTLADVLPQELKEGLKEGGLAA